MEEKDLKKENKSVKDKKNKSIKNQSSILITCISCIVLLLTLCYFGVSGTKGTYSYSASDYECSNGSTPFYASSLGKYVCAKSTYNTSSRQCVTTATDSLDIADKEQAGWSCNDTTLVCTSTNLSMCTTSATLKDSGEKYYAYFRNYDSSAYSTKDCTTSSTGTNCQITTPSSPSRNGYTFTGWGKSSGCTSGSVAANTGIYISGDVTYYACFSWNGTTNTVNFMNDSSLYKKLTCDVTVSGRTTCQITTPSSPSRDGYTFTGWGKTSGCTSGSVAANVDIYVSDGDKYYACYQPFCYRCFMESNINGTVPDAYRWTYTDDLACNSVAGSDCDNITVSCYRDSTITSESACPVGSGTTDDGADKPSGGTNTGGGGSYIPDTGNDDDYDGGNDDYDNTDDDNDDTGNNDNNNNDDNNVTDNPQTGSLAIFICWVVALGTICYAVWYFRSLKKSN